MAGLTSHYSTNGMYMAIVVIYVFCNTLCINKISKKYYKPRVILLVTMIALLMTGKRAHLLFTVVAVVVVYYFYKSNKPHGRILKIVLGLALGIVIVFWLSLMYPNLFSSFSRFISIAEDGDITTGRIDLWIKATDYFKKYPVCGIGFKQFIRIEGLDVHNVFLQLLCETGVLGFLTHVIPMSLTMFSSIRHLVFLRKKHLYNNDTEKQFYMTFAVCYQMFFLMYCITGNPWYDLPTLFPYMFCVGINLYFSREMKVFKKDIRNSR